MKYFKIAHLSDMHCNASKEWTNISSHILNCLVEMKPDIIAISGDLVDQPREKNFKALKVFFDEISKKNRALSPKILIVPGNHDYYRFGCKLPIISQKRKLYNDFQAAFFKEQGGKERLLSDIARDHKAAFFLLDSNLEKNGALAQGSIPDADSEFYGSIKMFKEIAAGNGMNYCDMLKIAILHHHPLPLATKYKKEDFEQFLLLNNSYKLLDICKNSNINLILHGHKHTSGLFGLKIYDKTISTPDLITICSCSSSGKSDCDKHEIVLFEVSESGATHLHRYISDPYDTPFIKNNKIVARYYGDIRKERKIRLSDNPLGPIKNIRNKTKMIRVRHDGFAFVSTALSEIAWNESSSIVDRYITERIRSDLGRVLRGRYEFQKHLSSNNESMKLWENPNVKAGVIPNPELAEAYDRRFEPFSPCAENEMDSFKMDYYISSGFALTSREHSEKYKNWPAEKWAEEIAAISVDYPIESLELIVSFPKGFFPSSPTFKVEAFKKENIGNKNNGLDMLYGVLHIDDEETKFLNKKGALRIRPENNEVSVIVKYPRTDLEYVLRWDLPSKDIRVSSKYNQYVGQNESFSEKVLDIKNTNKIKDFYNCLDKYINANVFCDNTYSVFLFGYDLFKKTLRIIGSPTEYRDKINSDLIVGRGPAGKAFLNRGVFFGEANKCPAYPAEDIVKGLNPIKVFAMPLTYPVLINTDGNVGSEVEQGHIYPSWGCISITSSDENSFIDFDTSGIDPSTPECFFCESDRSKEVLGLELIKKYKLINMKVKQAVLDFLSDIND